MTDVVVGGASLGQQGNAYGVKLLDSWILGIKKNKIGLQGKQSGRST